MTTGGQLREVAGHDEPDAAERDVGDAARGAEESVETVGEVGAEHADLVDHDRVYLLVKLLVGVIAAGFAGGGGRVPGAYLAEVVDGEPVDVEGGYPGGAQSDGDGWRAVPHPPFDETGFACAGAACDEHAAAAFEGFDGRLLWLIVAVHALSHASPRATIRRNRMVARGARMDAYAGV